MYLYVDTSKPKHLWRVSKLFSGFEEVLVQYCLGAMLRFCTMHLSHGNATTLNATLACLYPNSFWFILVKAGN